MKLLDIRQRASAGTRTVHSWRPELALLRAPNWARGGCHLPLALVGPIAAFCLGVAGCNEPTSNEGGGRPEASTVTVYCSVDEQFARRILDDYAAETGARVTPLFDSEAGKTTGLINRIREEADAGRVRADVFWSSELFGTMLLGRDGLLEPYRPAGADAIPGRYKDPGGLWTAVANRARVVAFDPSRTSRSDVPARWEDLAKPGLVNRVALANPLFGTTRGHVAAMRALWGENRFEAFLRGLKEGGATILDGNSATVRAVTSGRASLAATDTDDVWVFQRAGNSLDLVYPDMGDGGTLLIPCSVAILKGAPHLTPAKKLADFLVSAELERALAESDSRNIPVRTALREKLGIKQPPASRIPFDAIADNMDEAVTLVRDILIR